MKNFNKINSNYNKLNRFNNKKTGVYIPKAPDLAYEVPSMFIYPDDDSDEIYVVALKTCLYHESYKTYTYDASYERFAPQPKEILVDKSKHSGPSVAGGSNIQYQVSWRYNFYFKPSMIVSIDEYGYISHRIIKKGKYKFISEAEYTKILLTMDRKND